MVLSSIFAGIKYSRKLAEGVNTYLNYKTAVAVKKVIEVLVEKNNMLHEQILSPKLRSDKNSKVTFEGKLCIKPISK